MAQRSYEENLPNYDDRWLHYGFAIGTHFSNFQVTYNNDFTSSAMDSVHSIMAPVSFGFSIGFIVNLRLGQFFDLRTLPKVSFYEHQLEFRYLDRSVRQPFVETTFVEFPLLLKFKSQRRKNNRMYIVGGITPGIEATGKKDRDTEADRILTRSSNLSVEFGLGLDIYYPLFKFSPEIRFSKGLINFMGDERNQNSEGLNRLTTNTFTLYLLFE